VAEEVRHRLVEGILEDTVLIERAAVVDLYTGFEKLLRFVGGLLYTVSKRAGKMTARRMREKGLLESIDYFEAMMTSFLLGGYAEKVVVEDVERSHGEARVRLRVYGTLLGSRLKDRKRPVDQPFVGYLAGWLEEALGVKVDGRELECASRGGDSCVFELRVRSSDVSVPEPGRVYARPKVRILVEH